MPSRRTIFYSGRMSRRSISSEWVGGSSRRNYSTTRDMVSLYIRTLNFYQRKGGIWLSGKTLNCRPRDCEFDPPSLQLKQEKPQCDENQVFNDSTKYWCDRNKKLKMAVTKKWYRYFTCIGCMQIVMYVWLLEIIKV